MYDVVLLDLDLTLFDFHGSEIAAFADSITTVIDHDVDEDLFERYRVINRRVWAAVERAELTPSEAGRRRFEELFQEIGLTEADPSAASQRFQSGLGRHGSLYDGAVEVLDALVERARLGLVTNGISEVQRSKVRRLELDRWFDTIVISDEVGVAKPDPVMFEIALDRLGRPDRERTVMVGDSLSSDVAGANAAGIASCWYNPDGHRRSHDTGPDHEIRRLRELLDLRSASGPR